MMLKIPLLYILLGFEELLASYSQIYSAVWFVVTFERNVLNEYVTRDFRVGTPPQAVLLKLGSESCLSLHSPFNPERSTTFESVGSVHSDVLNGWNGLNFFNLKGTDCPDNFSLVVGGAIQFDPIFLQNYSVEIEYRHGTISSPSTPLVLSFRPIWTGDSSSISVTNKWILSKGVTIKDYSGAGFIVDHRFRGSVEFDLGFDGILLPFSSRQALETSLTNRQIAFQITPEGVLLLHPGFRDIAGKVKFCFPMCFGLRICQPKVQKLTIRVDGCSNAFCHSGIRFGNTNDRIVFGRVLLEVVASITLEAGKASVEPLRSIYDRVLLGPQVLTHVPRFHPPAVERDINGRIWLRTVPFNLPVPAGSIFAPGWSFVPLVPTAEGHMQLANVEAPAFIYSESFENVACAASSWSLHNGALEQLLAVRNDDAATGACCKLTVMLDKVGRYRINKESVKEFTPRQFVIDPSPVAAKGMSIQLRQDETEECAICLENIEKGSLEAILSCGHHNLHPECLTMWNSIRQTCPTCRQVHK